MFLFTQTRVHEFLRTVLSTHLNYVLRPQADVWICIQYADSNITKLDGPVFSPVLATLSPREKLSVGEISTQRKRRRADDWRKFCLSEESICCV